MESPVIRLLLVEDDREDVFLFRKLLNKIRPLRFDLVVCEGVKEALKILDQQHIDLIISDFVLGLESGLDLLKHLRKSETAPPVIMITSMDQREVDIACMRAGAKEYLKKGSMTSELLDRTIRYTLRNHQAEQDLKAALNVRDQMLSIISHDICAPIATLRSTFKFCAEQVEQQPTPTLKKFLSRGETNAEQLLDLTTKLLHWARAQTDHLVVAPEVIECVDLIRTVHAALEPVLHGKELELVAEVEQDAIIYADREMVETVLRNLLSNAIKFSHHGKTVYLTIRTVKDETHLIVRDEGLGMGEELRASLFDQRKKTSRPGTSNEAGHGLGLMLVKSFVQRNHGAIEVESELGVGTTFTVKLPNHVVSTKS
ncbi:MAG: hybrid sensor histidine kinase/response regulator [Verrucomicrobiota bacterium JB022]|nr:hybrid sensor histidine kinase/response regulator [Verrucomicrobiota bacterium JB022]